MQQIVAKSKTAITRLWGHFCTDSLFRNSIYLMLSVGVLSIFGFLFWMLAARIYPAEQVGVATALISVSGLIVAISTLGFDNGLMRFLGNATNKNERLTTAFSLTFGMAILSATSFLFVIGHLAPELQFVAQHLWYALGFVAIICLLTANILIDSTFIALRSTKYTLGKNIIYSVAKLLLPALLVSLGAMGIFLANGLAILAALMVAGWFLYRAFGIRFVGTLQLGAVADMAKFTTVSYIANLSCMLTTSLLPIIVLSKLGNTYAAYFYMAVMVTSLLNIIPKATSQSLMAEGSIHGADLARLTLKSLRIIGMLLVPAVIVVAFLGQFILLAFGKSYSSESQTLLQLLAGASIFGAVNYLGDALLHIQKRVRTFLAMNTINTGLILAGSFIVASGGLTRIGLVWLGSQILTSVLYTIIFAPQIICYIGKKGKFQ